MTEEDKTQKKTLMLNKTIKAGSIRPTSGRSSGTEVKVEIRRKRTFSPHDEKQKQTSNQQDTEKFKKLIQAAAEKELNKPTEKHVKRPSPVIEEPSFLPPDPETSDEYKRKKEKDHDKDQSEKEKDEEKAARKTDRDERRRSKLTISMALTELEKDDDDDTLSDLQEELPQTAAPLKLKSKKIPKKSTSSYAQKIEHEVVLPDTITVKDLANRMAEQSAKVIKTLMNLGIMATINQSIDADTAELVIQELGHKVKRVTDENFEEELKGEDDHPKDLQSRPPVVTVMGHVDHGKTSLLDALRTTDVAKGEAGGITQHIGAYQITTKKNDKITFIDTPGHEAFSAMRARGAQVTDIVILVVAADDSLMPQTIEAIDHAKAAQVPIIVAINKIDLPNANPQKIKTDLLQHGIIVEEMGGEVLCVEVSAKQKQNLDKLEEAILLQTEMLDLKANPNRHAEGVVIESKLEKGRGSVATILIQRGTLSIGDICVAGSAWGHVRALLDDHNTKLKQALPSMPVEILGLQGTPAAGDPFTVVLTEARAREIVEYRLKKIAEKKAVKLQPSSMEEMLQSIQKGEAETLPVIIKADVQGSVEALSTTLEKISTEKAKVKILHTAVGGINESDITLAKASGALIIGFNVRANQNVSDLAKKEGISLRYYSIIYDVADDIKKALSGLLAPEIKENIIGYADVRQIFSVGKSLKVAGCMVTEGLIKRSAKIRLLRNDIVTYEGKIGQLKHVKDDVKEARNGTECGISFENYNDLQVGDRIECFETEEIAATL